MGDFSNQLSCSIGPASFQLTDWSLTSAPDLEARFGTEIGRKIELSGEGEITGTDASDFATAVRSGVGSFEVAGQDLVIRGLSGQVEYQLLAAGCWVGPHVTVNVMSQGDGVALVKRFTWRATATICNVVDPTFGASDSRTCSVNQRPDGLVAVSYKGTLRGGSNLEAAFASLVSGPIGDAYPWPLWTMRVAKEFAGQYGSAQREIVYTISVEEMLEALPGDGYTRAVDGQYGYRRDRDEMGRVVVVESWDLLMGAGTVEAMEALIRPTGALLRESFEFSGIRERRVRAQYTTLIAGDASGLLEWEQRISVQEDVEVVKPVEFEGAGTILVRSSSTLRTLKQSGRAVKMGGAATAAAALMPTGYAHLARPVIDRAMRPDGTYETAWQYELGSVTAGGMDAAIVAALARPTGGGA